MALNNLIVSGNKEEQNRRSSASTGFVDFSFDLEKQKQHQLDNKSETGAPNISSWVSRQLMDIEILYILNFGPRTGYDLKKLMLEMFNADISFGTIYPHLRSMEKSGLIAENSSQDQQPSEATIRKICYAPTREGEMTLRQAIASIGKIGLSMNFTINKVDFQQDAPALPKSNERISVLHTLQAILERRGYAVLKDSALRGFSGKEYRFDMVAKRSFDKKTRERILFQLIDQRIGSPMGLDRAMRLLVAGQDIGAKVLLLAIPPLNIEVVDFLNFHEVPTFEGESWQSVLSDFVLMFDKSLE